MQPSFVQFGRYRLFKPLKKGGMARVHVALDAAEAAGGNGQLYAVKTLLPELAGDKGFREMFTTEGKVGLRLRHPNIVRTFDAGVHEGTAYIAMELIAGQDVASVLKRLRRDGERLPLPLAVAVARDVCAGLDYAHGLRDEQGQPLEIVNRDVSPGNVMMSWAGEVKLIDFGIAQTTIDVRAQIGTIKGKLNYMSPEQIRGLPVDPRSDVFAVGVMLYELATGVQVFRDDGDFATMERVRRAEFDLPSTHNAKVDAELDAIVSRALAREVEDRPTSRALHRLLSGWLTSRGFDVGAPELGGFVRALFGAEADAARRELEVASGAAGGLQARATPTPMPRASADAAGALSPSVAEGSATDPRRVGPPEVASTRKVGLRFWLLVGVGLCLVGALVASRMWA
jgi:serine/threonine protein kinase